MLGVLGDDKAVHKKVAALFGIDHREIGIFGDHGHGVTVVVGRDDGLSTLHLVKDLVHDIHLHQHLLLLELLGSLGQLGLVGGIHRIAAQAQGDTEGVARVAEHQDVADIFGIPQALPGGDFLVGHSGVVNEAHHAPVVGHHIFVGGVAFEILVKVVDILIVGDIAVIQLLEHPLLDQPGDHIVGRHKDIVARPALELGVHILVAGKGGIVDTDARQILKGADNVKAAIGPVGDILTPVENIERDVLAAEALVVVVILDAHLCKIGAGIGRSRGGQAERGHGGQRQQQAKQLFHSRTSFALWRSARISWKFMTSSMPRMTTNMMADSALICGLTRRRVIE